MPQPHARNLCNFRKTFLEHVEWFLSHKSDTLEGENLFNVCF